jgi:hypothetical protein
MAKLNRNPRRAYDSEGREIEPMSLANMREHGVRSVEGPCEDCKREALVNVEGLPDSLPVPDVALRLRCSGCGSKQIVTRPNWREHLRYGMPGYVAATDAAAADEKQYEGLAAERPEDGVDETLH